METLKSYLRARARLVGLTMSVAVLCASLATRAPSLDAEGVRSALAQATGLTVSHFVWEPSRGLIADLVCGRPVLFEATEANGAEAEHTGMDGSAESPATSPPVQDIYRAFARVTPEGQVLSIGAHFNLTRTRTSNEHSLSSTSSVAAFVSETKGAPPSVSLLHLSGESGRPQRGLSLWQRWQLGISRWLETGSSKGLGRTDILGSETDHGLSVVLEGREIELTSRVRGEDRSVQFALGQAPQDLPTGLQLIVRRREPLPVLHFAANAGRRLVGNDWIAWAEGRLFTLQDFFKRTAYSVSHPASEPSAPAATLAPSTAPAPLTIENTASGWPPQPLAVPSGRPGDGTWRAVQDPLLPPDEVPLFYRAVLRPDEERPYAELHLVAMDMRRLGLGMGAGYEDPEPDSGPPGSGQIPNDPQVFTRVVATFNGAFKATHGGYGMKAEGRVLVEPRVGAATVTVDNTGRVGFGTWKAEDGTEHLRFLRQNLEPLLAAGVKNPSGRRVWGDHLLGAHVAAERSALCHHESGHVFYAWATEATGESLAHGLALAGCRFAIHLDMNPGHCSFSFNRIHSIDPLSAQGHVLDPRMKVNASRFVRWSPKDFFYVYRRSGVTAEKQGNFTFEAAPGQHPPPSSVEARRRLMR